MPDIASLRTTFLSPSCSDDGHAELFTPESRLPPGHHPPDMMSPAVLSPSVSEVEDLVLIAEKPLPAEKYPRTFEKRERTGGFYVALGLVLAVWMITPLSW